MCTARRPHNRLYQRSRSFSPTSLLDDSSPSNESFLESPLCKFKHLHIQWISNDISLDHFERVTGRKGVEEAGTVSSSGKIVHIVKELAKSMLRTVEQSYSKDIESVFGECASLVKAANVDLPAYIDPSGRDTKDSQLAKTVNRKAGTNGQGSRESWRNDDCDEVQSTENDRGPFNL